MNTEKVKEALRALISRALRPIKSFNIENRALKVISKEKPTPAPTYKKNIEDIQRALRLDPSLDEKLDKKNPELDVRLKDVYVTSYGRPEDDITYEKRKQSSNKALPQNRRPVEEFEYGFKEPDNIPVGHTTLRIVMNFVSAHQMNPKEVTPIKIAEETKIKFEDVEKILKYFKPFEMYIPESQRAPARFAGPAHLRREIEETTTEKIEDDVKPVLTQGWIKDLFGEKEVDKVMKRRK